MRVTRGSSASLKLEARYCSHQMRLFGFPGDENALRVHLHGAELDAGKLPAMAADAGLHEKGRARIVALDQNGR